MKKQNPLISAAMAVYNGEKFLREQIESILNQTYKNIELVICDDCSTDKTVEIITEYERKYPNIRVYRNNSNIGLNKNFEQAVSHCKGEYIAISDQDDIWNADKLELLINNIENYDVICSKKIDIDENNNIIKDIHKKSFELAKSFKYNERDFLKIFYSNILWGCTSLIKKSFLVSCFPFPSEIIYYDHWVCLSAYINKSLKFIERDTVRHRVHSNNATRNTGTKNPYINWVKNLNKKNTEKYYTDFIGKIDLITDRLPVSEKYRQELIEIREIYKSVLDFKFKMRDIILFLKEFELYTKLNRRGIFIVKSAVERILLAFCFNQGGRKKFKN